MNKINFQDYPNTTTPVDADNLNLLQDNVEDGINTITGDLNDLETENTSSLVDAINEVNSKSVEVLNEYSQSTEEVYSADYVNEIIQNLRGKILWTNPNPTNAFAEQTITVDMSNYDMYEIIYRQGSSSSTQRERTLTTGKLIKGTGTIMTWGNSSNIRSLTQSGNNFTFDSGDSANIVCIPNYIIGYKTGLFD